ncbi:hypothetical protein [Arthrobacter sp. PsM3]|uniref:hypothetical protein n=1 Tax=Arthrobacter sp. PsM3 TaxID=3030531 RepID=UPI00263AD523|nr:hypothetical protein [Arthrobacter sp. PsM3]MDN4644973.1 hypothetical protein [Arthrobacter sp. PsM3]
MNDRTITRAARTGTRTQPVESKPHPKSLRGNLSLTPDEVAIAMELARKIRTKQDIAAYAARKRTS